MKIIASTLASAMKQASQIVQNRNTIPILACVKLTASNGALEIVTSDMDVEYVQRLPSEDHDDLSAAVDAKKLAALASAVPASNLIAMAVNDGRLVVSSGRSRWLLPILPASDFPAMPAIASGQSMEAACSDITKPLNRVSWAISDEATRIYLNGIYWHNYGGNLCVAATNGHAACMIETGIAMPDFAGIIIPTKIVDIMCSILADKLDTASIVWDDRKISVSIGEVTITGKLIDGTFPDYRRIIPAPGTPIVFDPESVSAAIKRIKVTASQTNQAKITRGDSMITISTSAESGESSEEIAAECTGSGATGINMQYLGDCMTAIGGDSIELHQSDNVSPMLIRRVVNDGAIAVIMPMRLN